MLRYFLRKNVLNQQTPAAEGDSQVMGKGNASSILGKNIRVMENSLNNGSWTLLNNKGSFIIDKQLHQLREPAASVTVYPRVNQRNANILFPT